MIALILVLVVAILVAWFVWALRKDASLERAAGDKVRMLLSRAMRIDPGAFPSGGVVVYYPEITDARQASALKQAELEYYAFLIEQQKRGGVNNCH